VTSRGINAARPMSPFGWLGLPALACVLATLAFGTPLRILGFGVPQPVFPLAMAFAWALIRPSVLPPFALLALGLFLDVFWGGPQGLWPLCLLAAYAAVLSVRRLITGQDFVVMWAWYAAATLTAFAAGFLLMGLQAGGAPNLLAVGWQLFATLLLFPFVWRLIERYEDADVRFR
jgi:rod shape-determining protein MreD